MLRMLAAGQGTYDAAGGRRLELHGWPGLRSRDLVALAAATGGTIARLV